MPVRPPLYKNLLSLEFETGSYFRKSIKKILYTWANKVSQHSRSSLETWVRYYSNCYEMIYRFNKRNELNTTKNSKLKKALCLSFNVFSTKVLIGDIIFYDRHFTWSSEPREGPAACSAKGVPSFNSYFKTVSGGPLPRIEPSTSCSAVKCSND